jgi:hypothetical protein
VAVSPLKEQTNLAPGDRQRDARLLGGTRAQQAAENTENKSNECLMLYPEYGAYGFFGTGLILHYTYEHVRHWRYMRRLRKRAAQQQETYKKNGSFLALLFALLAAPAAAQTIPSGLFGSINYWGVGGLSQVLSPGLAGQCLQTQGVGSAPVWVACPGSALTLLPPINTNQFYGNVSGQFAPPIGVDVNTILNTVGYDIARPPAPESILYKSNIGPTFNWQALPPGGSGIRTHIRRSNKSTVMGGDGVHPGFDLHDRWCDPLLRLGHGMDVSVSWYIGAATADRRSWG